MNMFYYSTQIILFLNTVCVKYMNANICDPTPRNEPLGRILVNRLINMRKYS
jgi:hypothetical protein